ncbi:MutS-related protein [Pararhodonellum marinum]|uniref:MutS-related protein n=1 Tax=Pararhodonellum marinum TaxID=2755358 RepID=UPI00293BE4EB|nr:DNA mismatch repair protein [Pararhodonellum marinum]
MLRELVLNDVSNVLKAFFKCNNIALNFQNYFHAGESSQIGYLWRMNMEVNYREADKEIKATQQKIAVLSIARLLLFFILGAVLIVGISEIRWLLLLFFPLSALFVYLVLAYEKEKDKQAILKAISRIQQEAEKRKSRKLVDFPDGEVFKDKKHPFANDLDLFGQHSLFQLINHTVNKSGEKLLVSWMKSDIDPKIAVERHSAIKELAQKEPFLLLFEAYGKAFLKEEKSKKNFYGWLSAPISWKKWYLIPMVLGPLLGTLVLLGLILGLLPVSVLSAWLLLGIPALGMVFKTMLHAGKSMPDRGDLKTFGAWSKQMEEDKFVDKKLLSLQEPFTKGDFLASKALKSLEQQSFTVQNRANLMYLIFNFLFWIDFVVLYRLEKWKRVYGTPMKTWENVFDQWQVLVSLSAFTKDEKLQGKVTWIDKPVMHALAIQHPLLQPETCVANDFDLNQEQQIVLLTGSNMSGKTTFMRTIGINMVLVNLGLSPFAKEFELGGFQLFTSMRNTDSLGESVSSFYAELDRIKGLLDRAEKGLPVFFLLDEILKGTNTTDRIMGSEALIRQLLPSQCKGIISTHDIELSELELKIPTLINHSFHSEIRQNDVLFDYKIKKGPCPSFNAHKLMELMGIKFT